MFWNIENGVGYAEISKSGEEINQELELKKEIQIEGGDSYKIIIRFYSRGI